MYKPFPDDYSSVSNIAPDCSSAICPVQYLNHFCQSISEETMCTHYAWVDGSRKIVESVHSKIDNNVTLYYVERKILQHS